MITNNHSWSLGLCPNKSLDLESPVRPLQPNDHCPSRSSEAFCPHAVNPIPELGFPWHLVFGIWSFAHPSHTRHTPISHLPHPPLTPSTHTAHTQLTHKKHLAHTQLQQSYSLNLNHLRNSDYKKTHKTANRWGANGGHLSRQGN